MENPNDKNPNDKNDERVDRVRRRRRNRDGHSRRDVPPGGVVTDGAGHLRVRRPDTYHHLWSAVPVGPRAALQMSIGLHERDFLIMLMAERAHTITTEQVARAFFDSLVTARKRMRVLRGRRFLATPEVDHRVVSSAVGHRGDTHNAPLVLDWNGKYLLEHLGYELRTWDPATVAQANSRFGHTLAVSEVWSYIVAAARATQVTVVVAGHIASGTRDRLAVGLLNERESVVYHEGCTGWSLQIEKSRASDLDLRSKAPARMKKPGDWRPRPLVRPDATLLLSVTSADSGNGSPPSSYRGDWRKVVLPGIPSPAEMRATEQLGRTSFRQMFLEMETGSNSPRDMADKVERYNRLYRLLREGDLMNGQGWRTLFGPTLPLILVAVRDTSQVDMQVTLWRAHFEHKAPGAVILADLDVLAQVYDMGRSCLLTQPCWLDMMRPEGPKWRSLGEILQLRV